ncbi:MAG: efflux RND transporter permease subunit [Acidobacteria bacterium]|nr:MAG: efflux RND transporter permease subunit [Acidobacteriota bacterium]
MHTLVRNLLRYRALVLLGLAAWLAAGAYFLLRLDIEAYPDPTPPLVEFITQNPSWSAEEMEQQVTIPIETALFGIPHLLYVRSISLFGLSDVKLYFSYGTDFFRDRQEAFDRLQGLTLPDNLSPQWSPWSPVGEIYRYFLDGPGYSLNELTATQDWYVRRQLKQVPGIIDVVTFGGTVKQYQAEIDPQRLLQFNVTLPQVLNAIAASNANVGGNYLALGSQNVNVRGIGLLQEPDQMKRVLVAEHNGVPVYLSDVADIREGHQPPLGRVGVDRNSNEVEGIVYLDRGEPSLPALRALRQKIAGLNGGLLPRGMKIRTLYDRTTLIHITTRTVKHLVLMGLVFVTAILLVLLGDNHMALVTAMTIPFALLFAFALMVLTGNSANLISIGAIDFGILVDTAVVVLENIHRQLHEAPEASSRFDVIASATADSARPVLFSTLVILVAFIPLFTMKGVPGKIFSPMSITYGFALTGALLFAVFFAPVLASFRRGKSAPGTGDTLVVKWARRGYSGALPLVLKRPWVVLACAGVLLGITVILLPSVGGEFMPKLEEGNLWIRATLPQDVSFEYGAKMANQIRTILMSFPEVMNAVSQEGRPNDGTDVTTFNNLEFYVPLKPESQWPHGVGKPALIRQVNERLSSIPGVVFNFSQNIEDNVEEAMSGVKGENSLKLFGNDIQILAAKAQEIRDIMAKVRGVTDLAVLPELGQPDLVIRIDRTACARYGLMASDVNAVVQAAIGGQSVTQILEGDQRFDFVVRFLPQFRQNPEVIRQILLPTADGGRVPLGQVAYVGLREGAFMIYRENGQRYVPIKFSIRGRALTDAMGDLQQQLKKAHLPQGYHYEWAGEYQSLKTEQHRLAIIVPISLLLILALLYALFNSWCDALIVMVILPFGAIGGVFSLLFTHTPFSVSAAVGFTSALGVGTLGGCVFLSGIRLAVKSGGLSPDAIFKGALTEMRPILMACLAAGLGLLPAAISSGIGAQAQQPLARVVVGAMITTTLAILLLIPVLVSLTGSFSPGEFAKND